MRRRACIFGLVAAMCLTAFSACGKKFDTNPGWESGGDSQDPVTGETGGGDLGETDSSEGDSGPQDTESASGERVFTKDFDGIVMTIVTDKSEYCEGDPIHVTAVLENTRDEDIYLYYGDAPKDYTVELEVDIKGVIEDTREPYDYADEPVVVIPVHPGERYEQTYDFLTYKEVIIEYSEEEGNNICYPNLEMPAEPGVYEGKYDLCFCENRYSPHGSRTSYTLDFFVTLI